jgi:hypothetical protein
MKMPRQRKMRYRLCNYGTQYLKIAAQFDSAGKLQRKHPPRLQKTVLSKWQARTRAARLPTPSHPVPGDRCQPMEAVTVQPRLEA